MKPQLRSVFLLAFMLLTGSVLFAQQKSLTEDFEANIPSTWSQEPLPLSTSWTTGATGIGNLIPQHGNSYAQIHSASANGAVRLITPMVDLSSLQTPTLSFWYAQPLSGTHADTLKLYYRTTASGNWQLIQVEQPGQSTWTRELISLSAYSLGNIQIAFEYNPGMGAGIALDDLYFGNEAVCTQPTNVNAVRINNESATLMWQANDASISYHIKVSTTLMSKMSDQADTFDSTVYMNPYEIHNLSANTTYYCYIKADCGDDDESNWSQVFSFSTICGPATLPIVENFEETSGTGTLSTCWMKHVITDGDWGSSTPNVLYIPYNAAGYAHGGNVALKLSAYYNTNASYSSPRTTTAYAISQMIGATDMTQVQASFWINSNNIANVLHVGLMSDPNDFSTFEEVAEIHASAVSTWEEIILPFTSVTGNGKYLAFMVNAQDRNATFNFFIDDVVIENIPTCSKPTGVTFDSYSSDAVTFHWNSANATAWNVKISTALMSDLNLNADAVNTTVTSNPATISGLTPQTTYYLYVQTNCGTDGLSSWSNPISFTTLCLPSTTLPYTENFDALAANQYPGCWLRTGTKGTGNNMFPKIYAASAASPKNCLQFQSDLNVGQYAIVQNMSTPIDRLQLSFSTKAESSNYSGVLEVGIMTNALDTSSFILIDRIKPKSTKYEQHQYYLANYKLAGNSNHIAFRHLTNNPSFDFYLDDVKIDTLPRCVPPLDLHFENISANQAEAIWTPYSDELSWNVKVSTVALTDPATQAGDAFDNNVSNSSLLLQHLLMGRNYHLYIQSVWSDAISTWQEYQFTTPCGEINSLPYEETFTGWGIGSTIMPGCWSGYTQNATALCVGGSYNATTGVSGSYSLYLYATQSNPTVIGIMPAINVAGKSFNDFQISFAYRGTQLGQRVVLGVMSDPADLSTFAAIDTFEITTLNTFLFVNAYSLSKYQGQGNYIAFKSLYTENPSTNNIYLDNILIEDVNACKSPESVIADKILDTECTISWTPKGTATSWEVAVGTSGFDPNSVTPFSCNQPIYTITGLTPATTYQVYVRSNCTGSNEKSAWSRVVTVQTSEVPESLPLICTFEDSIDNAKWQLLNGTQFNHWVIGTSIAQSGDKSIYISTETGDSASYAYSNINMSFVTAARLVHFDAGNYRIRYNWRSNGEAESDLARVCLVNYSVDLADGRNYGMSGTSNTLPNGWMALDEGSLSNNNKWVSVDKIISIAEAANYNVVLFWKNDNADGANPPAAIDNLQIEPLVCSPATDFVTTATDNGFTLQWSNLIGANLWDVKVSTVPLTSIEQSTGNLYDSIVTTNQVQVAQLQPNTAYYVYVRTHCPSGNIEDWSEAIVRTACQAIGELPYEESFNNEGTGEGSFPFCWTLSEGYMKYPYIDAENHSGSGQGAIRFYTPDIAEVYNVIAAPRLTADSIKKLNVSFFIKGQQVGHKIEIGVMNNPNDASTFIPVDTILVQSPSTWEAYTVMMNTYTGNGEYVAFRVGNQGSHTALLLDDIRIIDNRSCEQPANLNASRITASSAKLGWSSTNSMSYNVKLSTTSINPRLANDDVIELNGIADSYYDLTDLESNTTYYCYVQSDCGDGTPSYWSNEYIFTTICQTQSVPYVESFVGYENRMPDCWNSVTELSTPSLSVEQPYVVKGIYYGNDSLSLKISTYYAAASGQNQANQSRNYIILPAIAGNLNTMYVRFNHKGSRSNTHLKVGYMSDANDASTFTSVKEITLGDWQNSTVTFANQPNATGYIALMIDGNRDKASFTAYIDQLIIDSLSCCQSVQDIDVRNIMFNQAELYWTPLTTADTVWQVQVSRTNVGLQINKIDSIGKLVLDTLVHGTSLTVTGLTARTNYYAYIRPICSDGTPGMRYPMALAFRTDCGVVSLPYIEGFDNNGTGSGILPECINGFSTNTTEENPYISSTHYNGVGSLYLNAEKSNYTYAVLPEMNIDSIQKLELSFMARVSSTSDRIIIGAMNTPSDYASMDIIATKTLNKANSWQEVICSLNSYNGTKKYIALISDQRSANKSNRIWVDDVLVQLQPTCFRPSELTLTDWSESTASFSWPKSQSETQYDVVVVTKGNDPNSGTPTTVSTRNCTIGQLQPATQYQAYVRSNCGAGDVSAWRGPLNFTTLPTPATIPMVTDFENDAQGWSIINGNQANAFYIGRAVAKNSNRSLYISEDQGLSNSYNNRSESNVYARKLVHLEPGVYTVSYDWMASGEECCDFGRLFLMSKKGTLTAGNNQISTLPSGSIALDNNTVLNLKSNWTHAENTITISKADNYYMVVAWHNNNVIGEAPALAIDNITITENLCYTPIVSVNNISEQGATVNWAGHGNSAQVKVSDSPIAATNLESTAGNIYDSQVTNRSVNLTALTASTTYYLYTRVFCSNNDTTNWVEQSFTTLCDAVIVNDSLSYFDNFDSYSDENDMSCWTLKSSNGSTYPVFASVNHSAPRSLYLYGSNNSYSYAATPRIHGDNINEMQVKFYGRQSATSYYLLVGVMTNPNDVNSFELIDSIACQATNNWQEFIVPLSTYRGNGEYVAFKTGKGAESYFYLDNVTVEVQPDCSKPLNIQLSDITTTSMKISWNSITTDQNWEVKMYSNRVVVDATQQADVVDTLVNTPWIEINGLIPSSDYSVLIRKICSATENSEWSDVVRASTACGVLTMPYVQNFEGAIYPPSCWSRQTGSLGQALTPTNSGWRAVNNWVLNNQHSVINIYGTNCKNWLVTPAITVDQNAMVSFDLALTNYNSSDATTTPNGQLDDRFIVIASRDNGATWDQTNMTVWDNLNTGNYSFNGIPANGKRYGASLAAYAGETIVLGFYAESTIENGDNDLHLDNMTITPATVVTYSDTTCVNNNYFNYGFNIAATQLSTSGNHTFSRATLGNNGNDTIITLNLYAQPNSATLIQAAICSNEVYNQNGFNESTTGTYTRTLTSWNGCDSVITLQLTVHGTTIESISNASICQNELPYQWQGKSYTTAGQHLDTLQAKSGCDSIIALNLTVLPSYAVNDQIDLTDADLPYHYMDTVFTEQTPMGQSIYVLRKTTDAGCDSIITLTVNRTTVGVTDIATGKFDLYPNPAKVDETVTIIADLNSDDLQDAKVEVFNSIGQCIDAFVPRRLPVTLNHFHASGVYTVRLTLKTGKVAWGRIVIR